MSDRYMYTPRTTHTHPPVASILFFRSSFYSEVGRKEGRTEGRNTQFKKSGGKKKKVPKLLL